MRYLVLYTPLLELWDIFQKIIVISPTTETGFTLSGAELILKGIKLKALQVTHFEFWETMIFFLGRLNEKFLLRKKLALQEGKK
jgi:hypothetical protein